MAMRTSARSASASPERADPVDLLVAPLPKKQLRRAVDVEAKMGMAPGGEHARQTSRTSGAAAGVVSMETRSPFRTLVE